MYGAEDVLQFVTYRYVLHMVVKDLLHHEIIDLLDRLMTALMSALTSSVIEIDASKKMNSIKELQMFLLLLC